ncbi:beta-glucosidase [Granulicella tundricola]|uniref:Glycoside hydrolase family 3 domain protein n=1 Tax=Granulicella tundricola (strain ATCC BAA-1859 / DSM 23138 / MP5ACTX9) TaxID=1198114 RepID=E8WV98_GRATM|nr:glycoside hydrolase family 3 C-terminal domain-containing protein [Granulicella tundricola]ADW67273.1 glycoside hydrolase family 3 domain protein [Granulicella tundricola MP5ACTX9]
MFLKHGTTNFPAPFQTRTKRVQALALAATLLALPAAYAQAPHPLDEVDQQKVDALIHQMTLQQKLDYIGGTGFAAMAVPSLNIPALEMSDGPYGTRSNSGFPSTTYAAGINLAASWDRDLAVRVGAGIGRDARARGVHFMLGPGVNIYRSPRNGRNFEYFGEDPFLSGQIATGYITGMQAQGVAATVKHFLGNNSEFLRHDSDTVIDERAVREIYLPAFEAAVKQGHVSAVMDSYNLIDGKHATQNPYFNIDILRKEWGFKGVLMSDWDATYDAIGAANGGLDIEMPTGKFMNQANLMAAVQSGQVPEAVIDDKVRHILSTAETYGWLDSTHNQRDTNISFLDARNKAAALDSAREGAVLLKNAGNILPLNKAALKTILVVGPDAYPAQVVGGGSAGVVPFAAVSGFQGIVEAAGPGVNVLYDRGLPTLSHLSSDTRMTTAVTGGQAGVTLETFSNVDLQGPAVATSITPHIALDGFNIKMLLDNLEAAMSMIFSTPPKQVSHRFTGFYDAPTAGKYILALEDSGEGSGNRVFVDGQLVVDNWKVVRAFQPHVALDLTAGSHKVIVEEFQVSPVGGHLIFAIAPQNNIVNPRAVQLAAKADVVVIEAGFQQESESEGGDRTFELPYGQAEMIREISAANPKTIVTITSGGNVNSSTWIDRVPGLLETWYAGQEGGRALAEILFGDVNPSGHLPATFEKRAEDNPTFNTYYPEGDTKRVTYKEGIFVGYRGYEKNNIQPLFPFGYGLSYTTFKFGGLKVQQKDMNGETRVTATFEVTNTGSRKGAEVAQLYVTEDKAKVARPIHELKGFERVELNPGETKHITIPLDARSFSYYDVAGKKWTIGTPKFTISVGDSVANLPLKSSLTLKETK